MDNSICQPKGCEYCNPSVTPTVGINRGLPPLPHDKRQIEDNNQPRAVVSNGWSEHPSIESSLPSSMTHSSYSWASTHGARYSNSDYHRSLVPPPLVLNSRYDEYRHEVETLRAEADSDDSLEVPIVFKDDGLGQFPKLREGFPSLEEHHVSFALTSPVLNRYSEDSEAQRTSSNASDLNRPSCLMRIPNSHRGLRTQDLSQPDGCEHRHVHFSVPTLQSSNSPPKSNMTGDTESPTREPLMRGSPPLEDECDQGSDESIEALHNASNKRTGTPHKALFGENGWLGRTTSMKELPDERYKKSSFKSFGAKIKQHVEDWKGEKAKTYREEHRPILKEPKLVSKSTLPISLDPRTQAKIFSELELMICVTANNFLKKQYKAGLMSAESINKITDFWKSKNRPQVVEFQFDQATQRELVRQNIRTFNFEGEAATDPVVLNSTLHHWKAVAKEMSVRTFCAPDSAIRKQLHDIHKILEMLGASAHTSIAFQELQMKTLEMMKEHFKKDFEYKIAKVSSHVLGRMPANNP